MCINDTIALAKCGGLANNSDRILLIQELVQQVIDEAEKAVHMVNELSLFATNEDVEDVATTDLRCPLRFVFTVQ